MTSLSESRSFLFPHRMMTMFWLASILASLSHVVRALYVSRLGCRHRRTEEKLTCLERVLGDDYKQIWRERTVRWI